jgi:hypothetical protein
MTNKKGGCGCDKNILSNIFGSSKTKGGCGCSGAVPMTGGCGTCGGIVGGKRKTGNLRRHKQRKTKKSRKTKCSCGCGKFFYRGGCGCVGVTPQTGGFQVSRTLQKKSTKSTKSTKTTTKSKTYKKSTGGNSSFYEIGGTPHYPYNNTGGLSPPVSTRINGGMAIIAGGLTPDNMGNIITGTETSAPNFPILRSV